MLVTDMTFFGAKTQFLWKRSLKDIYSMGPLFNKLYAKYNLFKMHKVVFKL